MHEMLNAIVPGPLMRVAREARDVTYLAAMPTRVFNGANLCRSEDVMRASLFQDRSIEEGWRRDHSVIAAVFGDEDLLGGICPGERRALYYLIRALKPRSVLEVGTHIGASTLYIARALAAAGAGRLTTVDVLDVNDPVSGPWRQVGTAMSPLDLLRSVGCSDRVEFVAQRSIDFLGGVRTRFDVIFLDGDHRPHTVYQEIALALNVLAPGGALLLHDYYPGGKPLWPEETRGLTGPFRALARITRHNPWIVVEPFGTLPWPTKQGVHATSLAWLKRRGRS